MTNKKEECDTFTQEMISDLVKLNTRSNKLPNGTDYRFFASYPSFRQQTQQMSNQVLRLLEDVCLFINPKEKSIIMDTKDSFKSREMVQDITDHCLEQIDICLDQIRAMNKNVNAVVAENERVVGTKEQRSKHKEWLSKSLTTLRPQNKFIHDIDNSRNTPFKPKLIEKPNALKPLQLNLQPHHPNTGDNFYENPYLYEIEKIVYPEAHLQRRIPTMYGSLKETPMYWVNTLLQLDEMLEHLLLSTCIGVDIEHHNRHTFQGLACVLQISTRSEDFLIDALELRKHLHKLNKIFTDPRIVKIFYNADQDILALQRDLDIYVVNMFDIYEATNLLEYEKKLSVLLNKHCNVIMNDTLEMSDWRMRPLNLELVRHARTQTHFLLYLWDILCNDLLEQSENTLKKCLTICEQKCKMSYTKPPFDKQSCLSLSSQIPCHSKNERKAILALLEVLFDWRDQKARELDESIDCILSNDDLLIVVQNALHREELYQNLYPIPGYLRLYLNEVSALVSSIMSRYGNLDIDRENVNDNKGIIQFQDDINNNNNNNIDMRNVDEGFAMQMPNKLEKKRLFSSPNTLPDEELHRSRSITYEIFDNLKKEPVIEFIAHIAGIIPAINKPDENEQKKEQNRLKKAMVKERKAEKKAERKANEENKTEDQRVVEIVGSKFTSRDRNNAFKLPRKELDRKRKAEATQGREEIRNEELEKLGPVLERPLTNQPNEPKKSEKNVNAGKKAIKGGLDVVNQEWPYESIIYDQEKKETKKDLKRKKELDNFVKEPKPFIQNNDNNNNNKQTEKPITKEDLWERAPAPNLRAKFEKVFDLHRPKNNDDDDEL